MRVVSRDAGKVLPVPQSLTHLPGVGVTNGAPEIAAQLVAHLTVKRAGAGIISAEFADHAGIILVTEGLADLPLDERHWRVVEACKALQNTTAQIILLERTGTTGIGGLSGLQGLSRTLRQEWPGRKIFAWSVDDAMLKKGNLEDIIGAFGASVGDAVLADGKAYTLSPGREVRGSADLAPVQNVWFVSGGARGVTAACAIELARRQPGSTFLLAGRSAIMDWPEYVPETDDLTQLRAILIADARAQGSKPSLPDIDRQARALLAGREIRATLAAIQGAGAEAVYLPVDIGHEASVRSVIAQIVQQYGPITGVVHGAGVLADGLLVKKTREDLQRVFQPKVQGLMNLLGMIDLGSLRHVGLFSSAAAVFGNTGQSDYAMANAWLNAAAHHLHDSLPNTIVKSFCWGPWEGGMVDAALAAHFGSKGIGLIGLDEGARIFADQILHGARDDTELLIGDEWSA